MSTTQISRAQSLIVPVGLVLHGLVHFLGTAVYVGRVDIVGLPYKTSLLGGALGLGVSGMAVYGVLWAVAGIGLLAAALEWANNGRRRRQLLAGAAAFSLVLTVLDADVAAAGVLVNLLILTTLAVGTLHERRAARPAVL